MSAIDYTGWLKITEGSTSQGLEPNAFNKPLVRLPKKPAPHPCQVVCVIRKSDRDSKKLTQDHFFESVTVQPTHAMFMSGKSIISPLSQKIGIPLIIHPESQVPHGFMNPNREKYENQTITYLLIQLDNGFANLEHQDGLGTALVSRLDYKPLSIGLLTTIHAYTSMLLSERYGSEDDSRVQHTVTPEDFTKFARKFIDNTRASFNNHWDIKL
ncbi:hypothetical protein BJV82DRAFT_576463 [Fennellomyces sp. T-0311]|nr:hypothetical protein BJV82DRAFT_576463 [Fennellomyces sp. T-0311]